MENTTANQSGLTLKLTKMSQYSKNGRMVYMYGVSGSAEAVQQYEADQAKTKKGVQYHEVTKAPLFWSNDLGASIVRTRTGDWRVNNEVERAVSQKIATLSRLGNEALADKLADRLADKILTDIEAMFTKRSAPSSVTSPEQQAEKQDTENLNGV